jgi:serine protease Do
MKLNGFSKSLTAATAELIASIEESLVVVQSGRNGFGAGIIWDANGLILTNQHVVQGGRPRFGPAEPRLQVTLADGRQFPAQVVRRDPEIDLALLKIEADGLPAAPIADSHALRVGEFVMAVGHPWGQRGMVTAGLISGLGRAETRGARGSVEIIRSDVRLAPGNSGGPLVNAAGQVIGLNTMIVGGDLGVAIPIHLAAEFAASAGFSDRNAPGIASPRARSEFVV